MAAFRVGGDPEPWLEPAERMRHRRRISSHSVVAGSERPQHGPLLEAVDLKLSSWRRSVLVVIRNRGSSPLNVCDTDAASPHIRSSQGLSGRSMVPYLRLWT